MELWESLTLFQRVLFCITVPFTVIWGIFFLMNLFGGANFFEPSDIDPDSGEKDENLDRGIRAPKSLADLFKMFCAFLAVGGWVGLAVSLSYKPVWAVLAGVGAGAVSVAVMVLMTMLANKIKVIGKIAPERAVGLSGVVTIPIPPHKLAPGQISVEVNGKTYDLDAIFDGDVFISSGTSVKVTGVAGEWAVVVPENEK